MKAITCDKNADNGSIIIQLLRWVTEKTVQDGMIVCVVNATTISESWVEAR